MAGIHYSSQNTRKFRSTTRPWFADYLHYHRKAHTPFYLVLILTHFLESWYELAVGRVHIAYEEFIVMNIKLSFEMWYLPCCQYKFTKSLQEPASSVFRIEHCNFFSGTSMTYKQHTCYHVAEGSVLEVSITLRTPIFC